jgi:hypothetical protein
VPSQPGQEALEFERLAKQVAEPGSSPAANPDEILGRDHDAPRPVRTKRPHQRELRAQRRRDLADQPMEMGQFGPLLRLPAVLAVATSNPLIRRSLASSVRLLS